LTLTREPFRRRVAVLRHDGHFARAVAHFVELERDQRNAPGTGDDAVDRDRMILVTAGVVFEIGNLRVRRDRASREKTEQQA
jgi:hypothetical protein